MARTFSSSIWLTAPLRLVLIALAGAVIASSVCLLVFLPVPSVVYTDGSFLWVNRLRMFIFLAPLVSGGTILFLAERSLKRGLKAGVWSDEELTPVRRLVSGPGWKGATLVLLGAYAVAIIFSIVAGHFHGLTLLYVLLLPSLAMTRLKQLLVPRTSDANPLQDWKNFKPMQSKHWGESGQV